MPDIILSAITNDLLIKSGDFVVSDSDQQETSLIINTFVGNWFEHPLCGVGIINYLAGNESPIFIEQQIKQQMETDGFIIESIDIKGTTINDFKINIFAHR